MEETDEKQEGGAGSFPPCARAAASRPQSRSRSRSVLASSTLVSGRGDGACVRARGLLVIMGSKTREEVRPLT